VITDRALRVFTVRILDTKNDTTCTIINDRLRLMVSDRDLFLPLESGFPILKS
jgi:hypothetical protein